MEGRLQVKNKPQYWLAEIDQHGNPSLVDGPHSRPLGVETAMYLFKRLGLVRRGQKFGMAKITITDVEAKSHGAHEGSIEACNIMLSHSRTERLRNHD